MRAFKGSVASFGAVAALLFFLLVAAIAPRIANAVEAAIAAPDQYGVATAEEILGAGGNAVDAAVAVAFTLSVTYPEAGNLGGGGFATLAFEGRTYFLDYRERAPRRASADMYLDAHGDVVPDASVIGARAAGVPGTVMGLWELHRRFGKLTWARDMQPAIRYARDGFVVSKPLAAHSASVATTIAGRTNFRDYFKLTDGQTLRQPELAATLARISKGGVREFYHGRTAKLLVAEMNRSHGLVDAKDLADYRVAWRAPLTVRWAGFDVVTAPPPSSGGIALLQLLKMREEQAALFAGVAHNSPQYVHLISELEKRAFADRAEYLGDPDYWKVPVAGLLDASYIARRAREVNPERPTSTDGVAPGLAEHHQTTHFSIVDRHGNAVSNTYTLNDDFGSGAVVRGAGFLLNNEMDDFSVKPGTPNMYGVVGGAANAIAPGKRPLSSMTPTILMRDGKPVLVLGSPGGSRIFTAVFQVICNWHDFGMSVTDAVAAIRFHHQLLPSQVIFDEPWRQLDDATKGALTARGYAFQNQGWNTDVQAVFVGPDHSEAAADPRGTGVGRVFR
jgi:gamma-glutamyltranspeptidase/glutathione hydrolase